MQRVWPGARAALALSLTLLPAFAFAADAPVHDVDPINAPLFSVPGQTRLAIAFGQKGEGIHALGGAAVSERWAVVAAAAYADLNNCNSCNISERRHIEAGLGWLAPATAAGTRREAFAGLGFGRFRMSSSHILPFGV